MNCLYGIFRARVTRSQQCLGTHCPAAKAAGARGTLAGGRPHLGSAVKVCAEPPPGYVWVDCCYGGGEETGTSSGETTGLHEGEQCRPSGEGASGSAARPRSGRRTGDEDGQDSTRPEADAAAAETGDSGPQPEGGFWHKQHRALEIVGTVVTAVAGVAGLIFPFWHVQPESEPEPVAAVELVDSDVDRDRNVAADAVFEQTSHRPGSGTRVRSQRESGERCRKPRSDHAC